MSEPNNKFKCGTSKKEYVEKLAKCENWEINKKKKLEEVIASDKCPYCQDDGKCKHPTTWFDGKYSHYCSSHNDPTKGKVVVIKKEIEIGGETFSDERVCSDCQNKDNPQPRESILNYFKKHNIKSIKLENNKLMIEYNNSQTESKEIKDSESQQIKSYAEKLGVKQLSLKDLEQSNPSQTPKSNKVLYIGLAVVAVLVVGMVGWLLVRNKNKHHAK